MDQARKILEESNALCEVLDAPGLDGYWAGYAAGMVYTLSCMLLDQLERVEDEPDSWLD